MPKKSKIKIRRSEELLAVDEELDRAMEHLDEVSEGVRDLLGTLEPGAEEAEKGPDEAAGKIAGQATEDEPPSSV